MRSSPVNPRTLLIAGAWLASIAITYSLGRLESPAPGVAAVGAAAAPSGLQAGGDSETGKVRPIDPSISFSSVRSGGARETVESVTGGEPMEDWLLRLLNQDDEIVRTTAFLRLLEALDKPEDIQKALEVIAKNGNRDRWRGGAMREATMLLQKWTQMDPKGAADFANGRNGAERWMASSIVLGTWTRSNPDEALAYAQANGASQNPDDGNWGVAAVVSQLAKTDVDRALQVAATEGQGRARGQMMNAVLSELLSQRGTNGAKNTILSLPEGAFRDNMLPQLAERLADDDGAGTAQWVMNSLPAGDVRSRALAEVINEWADNDAVAAGNYLSRLPPSPETDAARERYAGEVLRRDPEGALAWASTISTEAQRNRTIGNLVRAWMRRDRPAAERWLGTAQIPDQTRNQLLRN